MMRPKFLLVLTSLLIPGLLLGLMVWVALAQTSGLALPTWDASEPVARAHPATNEPQDLRGKLACDVPLTAVGIAGPASGYTDVGYTVSAVVTPTNATLPILYNWSPEPEDGQGTVLPLYLWAQPGLYTINLEATNCDGSVSVYASKQIHVIDAQVTASIVPQQGGTLVFTDFVGNETSVEASGTAVLEAIDLVYTYLETPSHPSGFRFANHAFTLRAYRGGQPLPGFTFEQPVVLTIEYADEDVAGFPEEGLALRTWDGAGWSSDGIALVSHDLAANKLTVTVAHLSEFALFGIDRWLLQMPLVLKVYRPPVTPECRELIANGGFENGTAWVVGQTKRPARYTTELPHTGGRSVLLGIKTGEPDLHAYSSVRQTITLPSDLESATLTFWSYMLPGQDTGDRREALILDTDDRLLAVLMRTSSGDATWTKRAYDLSAFAGQTVKVYLNAYNDGDGQAVAGFYLDDVSVEACTSPDPPPPPPTPEPPVPPACYPYRAAMPGVGNSPHGIGVNSVARRIYVANHEGDSLSILDATNYNLVGTVSVGDGPNGVAYNPTNDRIYVANRNSSSVSVLRADNHVLIKTIPVGALPDGVAVNPVTNRVYVANYGDNTVSVIDGATNSVVSTIPTGLEPAMIAVDTGTNKAYVALHNENKVAVINGSGAVTKVSIGAKGGYGIAVDELRHRVYAATIDTARIAVVQGSAASDTLLGWAEIRRTPDGKLAKLRMIAVNPYVGASGHLYVTSAASDGGLDQVLLLTKGWEQGFGTPQTFDLVQPREGIAFDPAALRVWVSSRANNAVAAYQDGEPVCRAGAEAAVQPPPSEDYQVQVCVAQGDNTCQPVD